MQFIPDGDPHNAEYTHASECNVKILYMICIYDILLNSMHEKNQFDLSSHNHQHSFSRWRSF